MSTFEFKPKSSKPNRRDDSKTPHRFAVKLGRKVTEYPSPQHEDSDQQSFSPEMSSINESSDLCHIPVQTDSSHVLLSSPIYTPANEAVAKPLPASKQSTAHSGSLIQNTLEIGMHNDQFELEAEKAADDIIRKSETALKNQFEYSNNKKVQLKPLSTGKSSYNSRRKMANLGLPKSTGHSLSSATRAFIEPRFGYDFGNVRNYTDQSATRISHQLNA